MNKKNTEVQEFRSSEVQKFRRILNFGRTEVLVTSYEAGVTIPH